MKLPIDKEWFEKRAAAEGDSDPTTGRPSTRKTITLNLTEDEIAELERLANPNRDAIRAEAFEEAAAVAYRVCAETRHVTLGDKAAAAIRNLANPSPATIVRVKPLEWEDIGPGFSRAKAPLFGNIRIEKYGPKFTTCYSVPGYSNVFADGEFATAEEAKAAAEAEYQKRMTSALSAPATEVDHG